MYTRRQNQRTRTTHPSPRRRLTVEALEARLAPAVYVVTGLADGLGAVTQTGPNTFNASTLRAAVIAANGNGQDDTIILPAGTYTLSLGGADEDAALTGDLDLTEANRIITILGDAAGGTILDAQQFGDRVFQIFPDVTATLDRVTVTNGGSSGFNNFGAGIHNAGALTLTNCLVSGNGHAVNGGGLYNAATGTLTLTDCVVSSNAGGPNIAGGSGLFNAGLATITNSTFTENAASNIENASTGMLTITGSTISRGGAVAGGIVNSGVLTVRDSTITDNRGMRGLNQSLTFGGGITNGNGARLTLTNSTLSNNRGEYGGGIYNSLTAVATVTNCTLADNEGNSAGGGIYNAGDLTLTNSIVANSTNGDIGGFGTINGSHNLIEDGNGGPSDTISGDPLLGPLQDNGGPTKTMALLAGSPATGAGPFAAAYATLDQRGFARPAAGNIDLGAYQTTALDPHLVTTAADVVDGLDGLTSLREAIAFANANPGPDTITFGDGSASGGTNFLDAAADTITLGGTELVISSGVTIAGPGAGLLAVSGNNASRVFRVNGGATISGLTVTGGNSGSGNGGGILMEGGSLALTNATVANNTGNAGGGVYVGGGTVTLTNATIANNTADYKGGGVYVLGNSTVTLTNATVANNTVSNNTGDAGGVYIGTGTVRLRNALIVGNAAFSSPEVHGTLAEQSSSLVGVPQGYTLAQVVQVDGDGRPLLADNGGLTWTIALVPGSPAINAGDNALAVDADNQPLTTDQRGTGFARLVGTVDIGAFEVQNSAPTVGHDQATVAVNEGSLATNSGTFDDAQGRGTVTLSASLGTVTQNDVNGTWSWSYTPADDLATPATVTISATDNGNLVETTTFTLSVANVLPTVAILGESSVPQGLVYSLTLGTVLDPGDDTVSQYVVHWGDGTSNTYSSAGIKTHLYATVGNFPITVDLVDEDGTHLNRGNALSVQVSPLQISIARIDKGLSNQRSMVRSLTVTLSSAVNAAQATAILSGLSLTGATGVTLNGSLQAGGTELKITFAGSTIVGGSLADGRYVLRYGSEEVGSFHRLFGDLNGNARVDSEDASIMRSIRNGTRSNSVAYNEYLDFDANAVITIADRDQFNRRVGISV